MIETEPKPSLNYNCFPCFIYLSSLRNCDLRCFGNSSLCRILHIFLEVSSDIGNMTSHFDKPWKENYHIHLHCTPHLLLCRSQLKWFLNIIIFHVIVYATALEPPAYICIQFSSFLDQCITIYIHIWRKHILCHLKTAVIYDLFNILNCPFLKFLRTSGHLCLYMYTHIRHALKNINQSISSILPDVQVRCTVVHNVTYLWYCL